MYSRYDADDYSDRLRFSNGNTATGFLQLAEKRMSCHALAFTKIMCTFASWNCCQTYIMKTSFVCVGGAWQMYRRICIIYIGK